MLSGGRLVRSYGKNLLAISLLACANIVLFNLAISYTSATASQLIYCLVPLIVALLTALIFKERLKTKKIIGIILGLVGVLIIILFPVISGQKEVVFSLIPNLVISLGAMSYSFYTLFSKKLLNIFSPFFITSTFIFLATVLVLPLAIV